MQLARRLHMIKWDDDNLQIKPYQNTVGRFEMSNLRYPSHLAIDNGVRCSLFMGSLSCGAWAQQAPIFEEVLVTAEKHLRACRTSHKRSPDLSEQDVENLGS